MVDASLKEIPHNSDEADALSDVFWLQNLKYQSSVEFESWLAEASARHPNSFKLKLYWSAIPAKRQEWYEAGVRCLALAEKEPQSSWIYYNGLPAAIAAADYTTARRLADLASENFVSWPPAHLHMLMASVCQLGEHKLIEKIWNFLLREHADSFQSQILQRLGWYFHGVEDAESLQAVQVISLGENCFPWSRPAVWGLRRSTWRHENQMPLNLGIQSIQGAVPILRAGFEDFFNPDHLTVMADTNGDRLPINRRFKFIFNHEGGQHWTADGFLNLQKRYKERTANFLARGCTGPRVYVWYLHRTASAEGMEECLRDLAHDDDYRLVIIDVRNETDPWQPKDWRTTYMRVPLPWPGYHWVNAGSSDTIHGVAFEKTIHDGIRTAMRAVANGDRSPIQEATA